MFSALEGRWRETTHALNEPDDHAQNRADEGAQRARAHAEIVCDPSVTRAAVYQKDEGSPTKYVPVNDSEKTVCQMSGTSNRNCAQV